MVPHNRLLLKLKGPSQLPGSFGEDTAWRFGKGTLQLATQIAWSCRMEWWSAKEIQKFNTTRGHGRGRPEKTWTEVIHKDCLALGLNKTHHKTRCLWWYYCPQITGTTLECEIRWLQGNYSLCGGTSYRGASWGLEAARWMLCWSYRSEVWQAFRQHFRGASQISEWFEEI